MSKWISVEDRLPINEWVDVWVDGGRLPDIQYYKGDFREPVLDKDGDIDCWETINPSHWMDQPTPPQGDE